MKMPDNPPEEPVAIQRDLTHDAGAVAHRLN